jgi:protoporphyrinogen oxidase
VTKANVLVIGGGPCGCAAAWEIARHGCHVTLVEQRDRLGGLASCERFTGNAYEYGSHVFHTDNIDLLEQLKGLLGPELMEFEREGYIHIKFRGRYFAYPLKGPDLIKNLSPFLGLRAGLSLIKSLLLYELLSRSRPKNTEEYLIHKFGKVLYEVFFRDYSHKVWGIPCSELDSSFGEQRIPRSDIFNTLKKVLNHFGLSKLLDSHPLSETVIGKLYYTEKGIGRVFERIGEEVDHLHGAVLTKTRLDHVFIENDSVRAVRVERDGEFLELEPDYVVSTIPLPVLTSCLADSAPSNVVEAGQSLRYRSISLVGLLLAKRQVRPAYFTYYPNCVFNRLSEPSNHGLTINPNGCSLIIAETVCNHGDQAFVGDKEFCRAVVDDIVKEALIKKNDIVEQHHYSWRYAYPIYELGYMTKLATIREYLGTIRNIYCTGRNGDFNYVNMHVAMQMGVSTCARLGEFLGEREGTVRDFGEQQEPMC